MNNNFKTFILLAGLTALLLGAGQLLGGARGLVIALAFTVVMNLVSYWFSDKIALGMSHAREVDATEAPQLHNLIGGLAAKAGLPKPRVYIIPAMEPNAFATGRNPSHAAVAVTEGIMKMLTPDELEGVIAHELAHVRNRDILISSVAAMLAGALTQLAHLLQWAMIFGGSRDDEDSPGGAVGAIVTIIVAPIAAMLIQMAVSRSREYEADRIGAQICGRPLSLANALLKLERGVQAYPMDVSPATAHMYIVNPLPSGRRLMNLFSTHPPIEARVERLRAMAFGG